MSQIVQVLEYCRAPVKDGVIKGVKIVGTVSRNNGPDGKPRKYPQAMLKEHTALYEGTSVYLFHPTGSEKRKGSRKHDDHFGHLQNIYERFDGKVGLGLFGDLHVKQSHRAAQLVIDSDGSQFGLSHNAVVEMDGDTVTDIITVNSVDLVDHPATTITLFESEEIDEMSVEEITKAQAATDTKVDALSGKLDTLLEAIEKQPEKKSRRLSALEDVDADGDDEQGALYGLSHEAFAAGLNGVNTEGSRT